MSKSVTQVTVIKPPQRAGAIMSAWAIFAAAPKGAPVVAAQLNDIAAAMQLNVTNLRIELSRFNRYTKTQKYTPPVAL
jgi:hypothetical protein